MLKLNAVFYYREGYDIEPFVHDITHMLQTGGVEPDSIELNYFQHDMPEIASLDGMIDPADGIPEPMGIEFLFEVDKDNLNIVYSQLISLPDIALTEGTPFHKYRDDVSVTTSDCAIQDYEPTPAEILHQAEIQKIFNDMDQMWSGMNMLTQAVHQLQQENAMLRTIIDKSGVTSLVTITEELVSCFEELGIKPNLQITPSKIH